MPELNIFYFYIIVLDILLVIFIMLDHKYFFPEEKLKLIAFVIFVPVIGAIYVLKQLRGDLGWYVAIGSFFFSITLWCHSPFCLAINTLFADTLEKIMHLL